MLAMSLRRNVSEKLEEGEEVRELKDRPQINPVMRSLNELVRQPNRRTYMIFFVVFLISEMVYPSIHLINKRNVSETAEFSTLKGRNSAELGKEDLTWDDIELVSFKRKGTVSMGFKARIKGREGMHIAKITGGRRLHWSNTELEMFEILNAPQTIRNIPKLELAIKNIPNPLRNRTYLTETLGMEDEKAIHFLVECENISVMVMEYLSGNRLPSTIQELRIFLRSLLTTFRFAHSRNVMMCDLHKHNLYFDGTTVKLFDWNAGFIYKPNSIKIHYNQAPKQLFPPEAWHNESAVHATVSAFDIWTTGLMIIEILKEDQYKYSMDRKTYDLVKDFTKAAMTKDPYKRPDANELLHHPFLQGTAHIGT